MTRMQKSIPGARIPRAGDEMCIRDSTEVELFAGAMRRLGEKHSVPTPVNDMLYRRIAELEACLLYTSRNVS